MSGRQGPAADGGAVDADGPVSLLPGLELFVHSLLFGDDGSQGVGDLLELLLVHVVELVHPLGKCLQRDNMQLQSITLSTTGYLRSSSPYHPHGAPIFPKPPTK